MTDDGTVHIDYHQFGLVDERQDIPPILRSQNGLIDPVQGAAVIHTGIAAGMVAVSVEARTDPPPAVDADGWEEIVDVSLEAPVGRVKVAALMAHPPDLAPLTTGPGHYRVRVHARGRDTNIDGVAEEPFENYLIVVWPGQPAPQVIHRHNDRYGTELMASGPVTEASGSSPDRQPERR